MVGDLLNYEITHHSLNLYGICGSCKKKKELHTKTKNEHYDVVIIFLKGNLTNEHNVLEIKDALNELIEVEIEDHEPLKIIIDLKEMEVMNSSGLNFLISVLNTARKKGGDCILTGLSDRTANILLITKLNSIFTVGDDNDSAMSDFKKL